MKQAFRILRRMIFVIGGVLATLSGIFLCCILMIIFLLIHRLDIRLQCEENPAVLEYLSPYLEGWATDPESLTREQLQELFDNFDHYFWVHTWSAKTVDADETTVVEIKLRGLHDWQCGYLYVNDGSELINDTSIYGKHSYSYDMFRHIRLTEQLYLYESSY